MSSQQGGVPGGMKREKEKKLAGWAVYHLCDIKTTFNVSKMMFLNTTAKKWSAKEVSLYSESQNVGTEKASLTAVCQLVNL